MGTFAYHILTQIIHYRCKY